MREPTNAEAAALEALIDACSLSRVLEVLSNICGEKCNHIISSYSDKSLAHQWRLASWKLQDLSERLPLAPGLQPTP